MNFSCTLASRMEAGAYFAPSITVIELAQETSVLNGSIQDGNATTDDLVDDDDFTSMFD